MTNQQFLDRFFIQYDKVASASSPGYNAAEISEMANEAQENLVLKRYNYKANRNFEGFEETEKRIQDLGELVRQSILTPAAFDSNINMPNGVFVTLPNTTVTISPTDYSDVFWFAIFEEALINFTEENGCLTMVPDLSKVAITALKRIPVLEVSHNEFLKLKTNPFNKPTLQRAYRMRYEGRKHEIITDGTYDIVRYVVRYIRKPKPIDLTGNSTSQSSELADHLHRELINETVMVALKNTDNLPKLNVETQLIQE